MRVAKKGVAIAVETIIYIILAVIVMTVLLIFFTGQAGPAQNRFQLETTRNNICGEYVSHNSACSATGHGEAAGLVVGDKMTKLGDTCAQLSVAGCSRNTAASATCVKNCCLTCPK